MRQAAYWRSAVGKPCPACSAAVRLATVYAAWNTGPPLDPEPDWDTDLSTAEREWKAAQHADECPNQERS